MSLEVEVASWNYFSLFIVLWNAVSTQTPSHQHFTAVDVFCLTCFLSLGRCMVLATLYSSVEVPTCGSIALSVPNSTHKPGFLLLAEEKSPFGHIKKAKQILIDLAAIHFPLAFIKCLIQYLYKSKAIFLLWSSRSIWASICLSFLKIVNYCIAKNGKYLETFL